MKFSTNNNIANRVHNNFRIFCRIGAITFTLVGLLVPFDILKATYRVGGVTYVADSPTEKLTSSLIAITLGLVCGYIGFKVMRKPRQTELGFFTFPLFWILKNKKYKKPEFDDK
jgi:hypothetical protein